MSEDGNSSANEPPIVLMELQDEHLLRCEQYCTETRSVFFLVDYFCDHSTGLANCNVMFRGREEAMEGIGPVRLALFDPKTLKFATLAVATRDPDNEDPRVLLFRAWTEKVPIPLGGIEVKGSSVSRMAIVVFHEPGWDTNALKLSADIVPNPSMYLEGAKCRRPLKDVGGGSVLRVHMGKIFEIVNPQDALEKDGGLIDEFYAQSTLEIRPEDVEEAMALATGIGIGASTSDLESKMKQTSIGTQPKLVPLWIQIAATAEYPHQLRSGKQQVVVAAEAKEEEEEDEAMAE